MMIVLNTLTPTDLELSVFGLEYSVMTINKGRLINIITVCRSPSTNTTVFMDKLEQLTQALPQDVLTIVLRDFNIDLIKSPTRRILSVIKAVWLHQYVTTPTTDYGSLFDHVQVYVNHGTHAHTHSNHDTVSIILNLA